MEQSRYRELLDEVQADIEDAERTIEEAKQTISELKNLEQYLERKVGGGGGSKPPKRQNRKAPAPKDDAGDSSRGMQTVEFGPDGFPK